MGAWGYKAFDNDESCAFFLDCIKPIEKLIKMFGTRKYYDENEVRGAAELIINMSSSYTFDPEMVESILNKLKSMKSSFHFIDDWNKPASIVRDLNRQIKLLSKILIKINK